MLDLLLDGKRGLVIFHFAAPEKSNPPGALPWRGVAGVVADIVGQNRHFFKANIMALLLLSASAAALGLASKARLSPVCVLASARRASKRPRTGRAVSLFFVLDFAIIVPYWVRDWRATKGSPYVIYSCG